MAQRGGVKQLLPITTALALVLMLLLTTFTEDMGPRVAEARSRTCETKSHRFNGWCVSKSNCGHVCQTEGFQGGKCRGFRRRCFCTKPCHHNE